MTETNGCRNRLARAAIFGTCMWFSATSPALSIGTGHPAGGMLSNCSYFRDVRLQGHDVLLQADLATGICWGAFISIFYVSQVVDKNYNPAVHICAPPEANIVQFIKVFIAFADQHPEKHHEPFFLLAQNALHEAFPCEGKHLTSEGWK